MRRLIGYASLGAADHARARRFYDATLAPLGIARDFDDPVKRVLCYAGATPGGHAKRQELYLRWPFDGGPPGAGNGTMLAFPAPDDATIAACHAAALAHGGTDEGAPGPRPRYGDFHGAYVRDPDGNKLCFYRQGDRPAPAGMIGYATLGTNDPKRARAFYDAFFAPLGVQLDGDWPETGWVRYRRPGNTEAFYPAPPWDGSAASVGNGTMLAFPAPDEATVAAVHAAGLAAGGSDEGAPGPRPRYGDFHAGYLRDPDGNKLCVYRSAAG
jgi:catechol 2,3-dioxygenase-like lactoylglutathione lyase family enzyme